MEDIQDKVIAPEEEKQQEEELLKETPADELRQSVIEKFGLDEDANNELIDKLVEEADNQRKTVSKAIKQKRAWREKAEAQKEQKIEEKPKPEIKPEVKPKEDDLSVIDQRLDERFEERELDSLDLSDEGKKDIKAYAKAANLKVKQVVKTDYFKFLKDKEDAAKKVEEASIGGKRGAPTKKEFTSAKPTDFDLSTEEGQKEYEEYKDWRKKRS